MSRELAYFPPAGTKYKWHPKTLNYSNWGCNLSHDHLVLAWPARIELRVDLKDGTYTWTVQVTDWCHKKTSFEGTATDAKQALLEAERVGRDQYKKLTPATATIPYYALCRGGRKVMPRSPARGLRRVGKQVEAYAQWMVQRQQRRFPIGANE